MTVTLHCLCSCLWPRLRSGCACSLKADNLLLAQTLDLDSDLPSDLLKVADLGMCAKLDPSTGCVTGMTCRGTPAFMARELLSHDGGTHVTAALDVYALGMVMFELFHAKQPYQEVDSLLLKDGYAFSAANLACGAYHTCMHVQVVQTPASAV